MVTGHAMEVLIGCSMRSGSTLRAHVLGGHSAVQAYGDLPSMAALPRPGFPDQGRTLVVKPPDLVFLSPRLDVRYRFDRKVARTGHLSVAGSAVTARR